MKRFGGKNMILTDKIARKSFCVGGLFYPIRILIFPANSKFRFSTKMSISDQILDQNSFFFKTNFSQLRLMHRRISWRYVDNGRSLESNINRKSWRLWNFRFIRNSSTRMAKTSVCCCQRYSVHE